jgi:uncharacterized protein (DUF885 family)
MTRHDRCFAARCALILAVGAVSPPVAGAQDFAQLAHDFVYTTLSFTPGSATQTGLHEYTDPRTGERLQLDELLDDFSPAALAHEQGFYRDFLRRLHQISRDRLDPQTQADYDLLQDAAEFGLFSLDEEEFTRSKPQLYAETLGSALFSNISLEYADRAARAAHLAARLERVPAYVDQAIANLKGSNAVYRRVALEETDGVADLIKRAGAEFVRGTAAEPRYAGAEPAALAALERFTRFVKDELPKRREFDWRMGADRFGRKWRYYLQVSVTPDEMLRIAEDSLRGARAEMLRLARPLHDAWFPAHRHDATYPDSLLNQVVREVLARIGQEHVHRDSLLEQAQRDAADLEAFIRDRRAVSLADFSNLRIIPTPAFMRGSFGVGGAVFAPALEPQLATFYWVTPIQPDWPADRAEAKLREYNRYKLLTLTIHEALPGHVVQGQYASRVLPQWRRLLRNVYGNSAYVEGWAVYTEHMMEDLGFNGGDSVKARLTDLKGMLRIYTNVIIDIRLHTLGMRGEDAVTLMIRDGFQERPEAEAKLQRAQLDYVQLNTYLAGVQEWTRLRREVEAREGSGFNTCRYHDTVLLYGAIPVPTVRRLYLAGVPPSADPLPSRCEASGK